MTRTIFSGSLIFALTLSLPSLAAAAEPVISDSGNDVMVSVAGVRAAAGPVVPRGDQIEVALAAPGATPRKMQFDDPTIKRIELTNDTLIVTVHHSRESTILTAQQARVEMIAGHLRLTFPRSPRHTATEKVATPIALASASEPVIAKAPTPPAPKIAPPAPAIEHAPAFLPSPPIAEITTASPSARGAWWLIAFGAVALAAVVFARRKKTGSDTGDLLRVIASRSLGGKARLLLVESKGTRLLISVDERGTRLLSKVDHDHDADDALGEPNENGDGPSQLTAPIPINRNSPSVAGLLKLRQHAAPANNNRDDDGRNTEWFNELAAATKRTARQ